MLASDAAENRSKRGEIVEPFCVRNGCSGCFYVRVLAVLSHGDGS
jgi:hypothetical protein